MEVSTKIEKEKRCKCYCDIPFTLADIFPSVYSHGDSNFLSCNYINIFIFWFFGYLIFGTLTITNFFNEKINHDKSTFMCVFFAPVLVFILYIRYEILFFCLITPFILISLFLKDFFEYILDFFEIYC